MDTCWECGQDIVNDDAYDTPFGMSCGTCFDEFFDEFSETFDPMS